jgi:hypothetical protein
MHYKTSTLMSQPKMGLTKKANRKAELELEVGMQAHIDEWANAGWRLHSFTSANADYISSSGMYTTRHFFVWEPRRSQTVPTEN